MRTTLASRRAAALRAAARVVERLEDRTLLSTLVISGTTDNDSITLTKHFSVFPIAGWGVTATVNGATSDYLPGLYSDVTIDMRGGTDSVNILNTLVPILVTDTSGLGNPDDQIRVGDSGSVQGIFAQVVLHNPPSFSSVTIDDAADTSARNVVLEAGSVTGLGPAAISWDTADTHAVTVHTGSAGGNEVSVRATARQTSVVGHAPIAGPDDSVIVGDGGSVQSIAAPLQVSNYGYSNITLDNSADSVARTLVLDGGSASGLAPTAITWTTGDVHNVAIKTGTGADVINVLATSNPTSLEGRADQTVNVGNAGSVQPIRGTLTITNPPSYTTLNINDGADSTARHAVIKSVDLGGDSYRQVSGLSPAAINVRAGDLESLNITCGPQADTVDVQSLPGTAPLNIEGGGGTDAVNFGAGGLVRDIMGPVSVTNAPAHTDITINDSSDAVTRNVVMSTFLSGSAPWGRVSGLGAANINYKYNDTRDVTLNTGPGGGANVVNIRATGGTGTTHIVGQSTDSVNVGNAGSVSSILAELNISNPPSHSVVTIDDSADVAGRVATLSTTVPAGDSPWGVLSGLSPASIAFRANDVAGTVTIKGGAGGNTFNVTGTPTYAVGGTGGPSITLNTGAGADSVVISGTGAGTILSLNGQDATDALTVNYAPGGIGVGSTIYFDGGAGGDTLTVNGAGAADDFSVSGSSLTRGFPTVSSRINYSNTETLVLDPGTFGVTADLSPKNLVATGTGTTVNLNVSQHLAALTVANGARVNLLAGGSKVVTTSLLNISGAGSRLDLATHRLELLYGMGPDPIAAVRSWVTGGYNGGPWNGTGITTSTADANHGLGFGDTADGLTGVAAHTILVRWTRYGDVNLDGAVGFPDLLTLAQNYGKTGRNWDQGDMNYDGGVAFSDLLTLAQNYSGLAAGSGMATAAPAAALLTVAKRRRR